MTQQEEIDLLREEISAMPESEEKEQLLSRLDALHPEAATATDEVLEEVRKNFTRKKSSSQIFKRKIMKKKFVPVLIMAVGIALVVVSFKMFKKQDS